MPEFVHLHNHSTFSDFDGAARVKELAQSASDMGMKALALTDHGNVHGLPEFQDECEGEGVKPILGVEGYLVERYDDYLAITEKKAKDRTPEEKEHLKTRYHQIVLAKNQTGLDNLHKLASWAHTTGKQYGRYPLFDFKRLKRFGEGLIVTSSCMQGIISQALIGGDYDRAVAISKWFIDHFGGDFYFEVHDHGIDDEEVVREGVKKLSKELGVKVICANDVHYIEKRDVELQQFRVGLKMRKNVFEASEYAHENVHFRSPQEMADLFHTQFPNALENTLELTEKVDAKIPKRGFVLPDFPVPDGKSDLRQVYDLCVQRLPHRYPEEMREEAMDRLQHELKIMRSMARDQGANFGRYFLVVSDITDTAREKDIWVGPGRGSAAGSITSYLLGITNIDPLRYDLLFERFLNPERVTMPDIDIDFQQDRRSEVIDYMVSRYGRESVQQVCTFGLYKTKTCIKDVARYLDVPYQMAETLTDKVPDNPPGKGFYSDWANDEEVQDLADKDERVRETIRLAPKIYKWVHLTGVHPCALVITPGAVSDYVPITQMKSQGEKIQVTQYDGDRIEDLGLLKMDILGLNTGSILMTARDMVEKNHGVDLDLDRLMDDPTDEETLGIFRQGDTDAIFQFESQGMKKYLKRLAPDRFEDLTAMNALYRPGPMENIPSYIRRKHGEETTEYPHPKLEDALSTTHGIAVYQEQVMEMARVLAGFTLGEADILRRAIGKKKAKLLAEQREKFVEGCKAESDIPEEEGNHLFDIIEEFAAYGFNKCVAEGTYLASTGMTAGKLYSWMERSAEIHEERHGERLTMKELLQRYPETAYSMMEGRGENRSWGPNEIVDIQREGEQEVLRLETLTGEWIEATPHHKFPVVDRDGELHKIPMSEIDIDEHQVLYSYEANGRAFTREIATLTTAGTKEVYNIEMAGPNHNFVAEAKESVEGGWTVNEDEAPSALPRPENGFVTCNSHAASYATIAYQEAYLKAHYPVEFMAAVLEHTASNKDKKEKYLASCDKMGIEVRPPSINSSGPHFTAENGKVFYGMENVKYVGEKALQEILEARDGALSFDELPQLPMQGDNVARIKSGDKTTTLRTSKISEGTYRCGEIAVEVAPRGEMTVEEAGGVDTVTSSESFGPEGPKYEHTREFLDGERKLWVHDLKVVELTEEKKRQPFEDLEDFVRRVVVKPSTKVNSRAIGSLIKIGAFDELGERNELLSRLEDWLKWAKKEREWQGWMSASRVNRVDPPDFSGKTEAAPMRLEEKLRHEMELLGQHVSGSPLDGFQPLQSLVEATTGARVGTEDTFAVPGGYYGPKSCIPLMGLVTNLYEGTTKKGDPFGIVTITGFDGGESEVFAWSEALEEYGGFLEEGAKIFVTAKKGDADGKGGTWPDSVEAVVPLAEMVSDWAETAVIEAEGQDEIKRMDEYLRSLPEGTVDVCFQSGDDMYQGPAVDLSPRRLRRLRENASISLF